MKREHAKAIVNFIRENGKLGINPNLNLEAVKDWADGKELERKWLNEWKPVDETDNLCGRDYRVIPAHRPYHALEFAVEVFRCPNALLLDKVDEYVYEVFMIGKEFVVLNRKGTVWQKTRSYQDLLDDYVWEESKDICGAINWPEELLGRSETEGEFMEKMKRRREYLDRHLAKQQSEQ